MREKPTFSGIATGIILTLAVAALIGLLMVYTGSYNVAATEDHTAFGRWALGTIMENSVERRAASISEPPLTAAMRRAGAGEYKAMCQQCHGGPGVRADKWAQDMLPRPPELTEHAFEWRPRELFWILENGIKMSAMPSFRDHDDRTLWNMVAFVKALPSMSAEQYAAYPSGHGHGDDHAPHGARGQND